ncbi:hypothetical protein Enr17x_53700 [Gimesia fumaroli]|uniref:Uncharacterized protein n=1 Tax=Gimesia fumaroli TaxID=2527976 RepID=A0A518IJL7_9PLAN|nr:hypothetical protein Enr17x_53700 [Gimesia fumaroli]
MVASLSAHSVHSGNSLKFNSRAEFIHHRKHENTKTLRRIELQKFARICKILLDQQNRANDYSVSRLLMFIRWL